MKRNAIETVMGAVVLFLAVGFLVFAYQTSDIRAGRGSRGYHVNADFSNIGGVAKGSDVRIGGVKVGVIDDLSLVKDTYQARLRLDIDPGVALPLDTSASIASDGLLGSKYVALQPGADSAMLKDGGVLEFTQSSVSLEELIGKFVFSAGGVDKGGEAATPATPSADPAAKPAAGELTLP